MVSSSERYKMLYLKGMDSWCVRKRDTIHNKIEMEMCGHCDGKKSTIASFIIISLVCVFIAQCTVNALISSTNYKATHLIGCGQHSTALSHKHKCIFSTIAIHNTNQIINIIFNQASS